MSDALNALAERYASSLRDYLAETGEAGLERAYELGRQAVQSGLGLLDVEPIHRKALISALRCASWRWLRNSGRKVWRRSR
jgi:hypothetical protein